MSSTRYAPDGAPLRQERYASSEEFNISLKASLVAQRCEVLQDAELVRLIWFLQFRSLPPRDGADGRIGGMDLIAAELLPYIETSPQSLAFEAEAELDAKYEFWREDWSDPPGRGKRDHAPRPLTAAEIEASKKAEHARSLATLSEELTQWALDPANGWRGASFRPSWIKALAKYRQHCCDQAKSKLANTSISAVLWDALEFTRGTSQASLVLGEPRIGKSQTAKVFCESQGGLARYVEVPSTNDERSLYKAVAEALGVANSLAYKGAEIRDRVEAVLFRSKLMLVLDEGQNLWPRNMRPRSAPERVQWINSLINHGVPVVLVALPEFMTWMGICAKQTCWSPKQIMGRLPIQRSLPDALTMEDFQTLTRHLAPALPEAAVKYVVGCALDQDGAAFVKNVLSVATYRASKAGRQQPTFEDIQAAVRDDIMPSANSLREALAPRQAMRGRPAKVTPALAPAAVPAKPRMAASVTHAGPVHRARNSVAVPAHEPA